MILEPLSIEKFFAATHGYKITDLYSKNKHVIENYFQRLLGLYDFVAKTDCNSIHIFVYCHKTSVLKH